MSQPDHSEILVQVFGRTDVGRTREHNEDAFVIADLTRNDASLQPSVRAHRVGPKGTLFMVADGMGGAAAGEIASQMATEIVLKELRDNWLPQEQPSTEAFARCLKMAAQKANAMIHGYATSHQEYRGMGTTATIAGLLADTLYLAQVGDSRAYLVREGVAKQITKDQSLMQKLIEAGELTEEEAAQSERRNIILQALGPEASIKVDLTYQRIRRGDVLVLCSDGLSGQVTKNDIGRIVSEEQDLVQACRRLIDLANEAGGPDNITVICARFAGEGLNDLGEGDDVGHRVFALQEAGSTPVMGVDRVREGPTKPMRTSSRDESAVPTEPVPIIPPATPARATPVANAPAMLENDPMGVPTDPILEPAKVPLKTDDRERRSRGMAVAIALLALLVVFAAWYAIRTVRKVQPEPTPAGQTAP
ncbi:MAG TPA: Stp1/IreP family PP2C-type Ser/Thr phosphatase [Gemmatimonadaceae bacterium]|nr:Stp1/IreP family PP2C-type Ser/Thr phosphatase [Gemmatimonadaceae bacterium]